MCLAVEEWAKCAARRVREHRLLVIVGQNGIGKSTACRGAIEWLQRISVNLLGGAWGTMKVPSAETIPWSHVAGLTREDRNEQTLWIDLKEIDILYLDDVGAEVDRFKNQLPVENLRLMLEARRSKFTLITTNVPPEKWAATWDNRVEDRLYRNSKIVPMPNVPSYYKR